MEFELTPGSLDDLDQLHDLIYRWERHWNVPVATERDEIRDGLTEPHLDIARDTRAIRHNDRIVAFGSVHHRPSGIRLESVLLQGRVDPDLRGNGLGRSLLAWQLERAVEKLRECDPSLPWFVRTIQWDWITADHHLQGRFGMEPVRWFDEMLRPLGDPVSVEPAEGVEILAWDQATPEETRQVINAAFADHWGSTPRDADSWRAEVESSTTRPDLSFIARDSRGELIGVCLNAHYLGDEEVSGRKDGWIDRLGVVSDWRRRGVATALIAASLGAFREAGFTHAALGVDSDSPTGAPSLYTRMGFRPLHRMVCRQIQIRPAR